MSTATCPNGHVSADSEWCDTCGSPMNGPSAAAAAQAASPASVPGAGSGSAPLAIAPVACPHCGSMNSADNLFCESCGYDFTTGQTPVAPDPPAPVAAAADPVAAAEAAVVVVPAATPSGPGVGATGWTIIVEVDPVWFSLKGELADRPLPPASTSTVPVFGHVSLIGRTSQSRGLRPEIALDTDTAVSRRHAQVLLEGEHLSVVDLSSTNGTYVFAGGEVPTDDAVPLAAGVPAVLADGDQIYVGAWSRLTVRKT
jgi:hypothetical protein